MAKLIQNEAMAKKFAVDALVKEYKIPESRIEVIYPILTVPDAKLSVESYSVKAKVTVKPGVTREHQLAVLAYTGEVVVIY